MPLARFDNLDEAQQEQILTAALGEFSRHGYEEASLARVAAEAKISKGTLYYYFADRDDLYATVVMRLVREVSGKRVLGAFTPKRPAEFWPAVEKLFDDGFQLAWEHPEAVRALKSFQVSLRRSGRPVFKPVVEQITANLRRVVELGRKLKQVRTDVSVELLVELLEAADEVLDRRLSEAKDARALKKHAELALSTMKRLLAP
jgi:AcrR family transcriptional regulator